MLSKLQHLVEGSFESSAGVFKRAGFSPDSVTLVGFAFAFLGSVFYAYGLGSPLENGGVVLALIVSGYFDAVDGAMARRYQLVSKRGGILDSVLDRVGELFLYSGLAVGALVDFRLVLWALSASFLVSYARARAEVEGIVLKGVGIAERPERLLILLAASILQTLNTQALSWGVGLIAALASVTVVERVYRATGALPSRVSPSQKRRSSLARTLETPKWTAQDTQRFFMTLWRAM